MRGEKHKRQCAMRTPQIACLPGRRSPAASTPPRHAGESRYPGPEKTKRRQRRTLNHKRIHRLFFRDDHHTAFTYIAEASITIWTPAFAGATVRGSWPLVNQGGARPIFIVRCAGLANMGVNMKTPQWRFQKSLRRAVGLACGGALRFAACAGCKLVTGNGDLYPTEYKFHIFRVNQASNLKKSKKNLNSVPRLMDNALCVNISFQLTGTDC